MVCVLPLLCSLLTEHAGDPQRVRRYSVATPNSLSLLCMRSLARVQRFLDMVPYQFSDQWRDFSAPKWTAEQ